MGKILIGVTGKANAGKDTVANIAHELFPACERYRFASKLKETTSFLFGWSDEQLEDREFKEAVDPKWGFSPRKAMQLLGTEFGRALREDLWLQFVQNKLDESEFGLIISDVRFENEAAFIRKNGGLLIHVVREGAGSTSESGHASENGVEFVDGDAYINNNQGLDELRGRVQRVLTGHFWANK